jgi:hypothetical protein
MADVSARPELVGNTAFTHIATHKRGHSFACALKPEI